MPNIPNQAVDSATTTARPLPGTPGGKMVGYAEAERVANPDPGPSPETSDISLATKELESASGKKIADLTEADFYRLPVKLVSRDTILSTELTVQMKDPSMTCRWFNHKAQQGQRVERARYMGYQPCTRADVAFCHATASDASGALVVGDLVLMKISKVQQFGGYYKDNAEKAKYRVSQQLSRPFGAVVPGVDNGADATSPYQITSRTGSSLVDATEARSLVFSK